MVVDACPYRPKTVKQRGRCQQVKRPDERSAELKRRLAFPGHADLAEMEPGEHPRADLETGRRLPQVQNTHPPQQWPDVAAQLRALRPDDQTLN
jgi:hypothetical protein